MVFAIRSATAGGRACLGGRQDLRGGSQVQMKWAGDALHKLEHTDGGSKAALADRTTVSQAFKYGQANADGEESSR